MKVLRLRLVDIVFLSLYTGWRMALGQEAGVTLNPENSLPQLTDGQIFGPG